MIVKRLIVTLVATSALTAAGCGSNDKSSNSTQAPATTTTSTTPAPPGGGVAIKMQGIAFAPKSVTVKVGQKITWTNDDQVDHNVVATSGETFKSANFGQGGTFSYTVDKAGTIKYVCTIHPGMDGTITVR